MAERRMFAKTITLSDAFLDLPMGSRCLYFTLGLVADDDGFVNSPRSIMRQVGAGVDEFNLLIDKKFIIPFDDGVIAIKHWRINNFIRSDRYTETKYKEDKRLLGLDKNNAYYRLDPEQIEEDCPLRIDDIRHVIIENGYDVNAEEFFEYYRKRDWRDMRGDPIADNWKMKLTMWNKNARDRLKDAAEEEPLW